MIVAGKQPGPTLLSLDEAREHGARGLSVWDWAGTEIEGEDPDVVVASAGDVPTIEAMAAVQLLKNEIPGLKMRFVNVVDLMRLQDESEHPHGLPDDQFDAIFTTDKPVIFAFHGYPSLVHRLTYRRNKHGNMHVRGFNERGTTTTPFDMLMLNDLDRFRLVMDVIRRVPSLGTQVRGLQPAHGRRADVAPRLHARTRRRPGGCRHHRGPAVQVEQRPSRRHRRRQHKSLSPLSFFRS